jgi:hypothetical protein
MDAYGEGVARLQRLIRGCAGERKQGPSPPCTCGPFPWVGCLCACLQTGYTAQHLSVTETCTETYTTLSGGVNVVGRLQSTRKGYRKRLRSHLCAGSEL